jgi:hypothetical protein
VCIINKVLRIEAIRLKVNGVSGCSALFNQIVSTAEARYSLAGLSSDRGESSRDHEYDHQIHMAKIRIEKKFMLFGMGYA